MPPPSFLPHGSHAENSRHSNRQSSTSLHSKLNEQNPHLSSRFSGSVRQSSSSFASASGTAVSEGKLVVIITNIMKLNVQSIYDTYQKL